MSFGQSSLFGASNNTQAKPLFGAASTTQPSTTASPFGAIGNTASTTAAPSPFGSLGNASQPAQSGGLFGSKASLPAQNASPFTLGAPASATGQSGSSPFILGAATTKPAGGLFGSTAAPASTAGGLFGASKTAAAPAQSSAFGSIGATSQPQQTTSLFGGAPAIAQSQGSNTLFGNNASTTINSQQTGGGLFGASTAQQTQPQQSGGLFGNLGTARSGSSTFANGTAQNTQQSQSSAFGRTAASQSMFGASSMMPGGGLTMGQGNQKQQTVPGVKIDVSTIRGTTRFNDLHEELQKQIEQIDAFIQQQISFKEQCDALMPAHDLNLTSIPNDVEYVKGKADTAELALDNDSQAINTMKGVVKKDADNAELSFKAVENLKLPQQFHYTGMWHGHSSTIVPQRSRGGSSQGNSEEPADLVSYFSTCATEMTNTLKTYQQNISEIEAHLRTVEANTIAQGQQLMFKRGRDGGSRSSEDQIRELAAVLREFEGGIINVAGKVGTVREEVQEILLKQQDLGARKGVGRY